LLTTMWIEVLGKTLLIQVVLVGQFGTDLCVDYDEKDEKPLEMK